MEDWFARPPETLISPSELNSEGGGQALVLRYAGCQMQCPLCYAWRYAWNVQSGHIYSIDEVLNPLRELPKVASKKIVWIRIQGGEPLLNCERIFTTIKYAERAVSEVYSSKLNYYPITRVVIQTNALIFNKISDAQVNDIKKQLEMAARKIIGSGRIVFEVSFKSSNDPATLHPQVRAYKVLLKDILIPLLERGIDNVAVYPLAGLGPSIDFHNVWLVPIEPKGLPDEIPLFHSSFWSSSFRGLIDEFTKDIAPEYAAYDDFRVNPRTSNGTKLAIEELEPTKFQSAWISRYTNLNAQPPINTLLRRTSSERDSQWSSRVLFGRSRNWTRVMDAIPIASDPKRLLKLVESMNECFYPSHPKGHYPYL